MLITEKHNRAIELILEGRTMTEVAKLVPVSRTSLYEWLKDKDFKAELNRCEQRLKTELNREIGGKVKSCLEVIFDLAVNSPSDKVKLDSSTYIIDRYLGKSIRLQTDLGGQEKDSDNDIDIDSVLEEIELEKAK